MQRPYFKAGTKPMHPESLGILLLQAREHHPNDYWPMDSALHKAPLQEESAPNKYLFAVQMYLKLSARTNSPLCWRLHRWKMKQLILKGLTS